MEEQKQSERIVRKPELMRIIGLSDVSVWRLEKKGQFPKRLQLGGNSVGWLASEVQEWIDKKAAERE